MEETVKLAPARYIQAADKLLKMKKTKPVWEVIEECFKIWADKRPDEWRAYIVHIRDVKETRKSTRGFRGVSKSGDSYIQYTLDIPQDVVAMIRVLYTPDELPMNKKFFRTFAKKFPKFKVSERV